MYAYMYICVYVYTCICIYVYMYVSLNICCIYMYLLIYVKTDRKIFYILLFWNECSTLEPLCPFIRHPLSKFTLRSCKPKTYG